MITKTISFLLLLFYVNVFAQLDHTVSSAYSGDGPEDVITPIKFDIKLIEEGDFPTGYQGEIMTPVCMDGLCQRVHILIYWDLLGNYQSYELPEGEMLTKTEHEPFSKNDYQKLHEILKKPHLLLQDFDIEKLLKSETLRKVEETDGYTGATAGTLRDHIVEGAVYSSYTLWHLVHGRIVDSLYSHTISELLDDDLFIRFLSSDKEYLEPEILYILANQLDINQQAVSKKVLHLLKKHQQGQKQLQKLITTFEKQSQLLW